MKRKEAQTSVVDDGGAEGSCIEGSSSGLESGLSVDMLSHLADHLLAMRDLAERGRFGDLSRLLDCAYEEAFMQLRACEGRRGSIR